MRYIVETEQIVFTVYAVDAENSTDAHQKFRNGEAEEVDQSSTEELIMDIYRD